MSTLTTRNTKSLFLIAISLFLGILHAYLFNEGLIGLNYPVFILGTIATGLWVLQMHTRKIETMHQVILILSLFFGMMVFVRSSELLTFFNIIGSLLLLLLAIDLSSGKQMRTYVVQDFFNLVLLPFRFIIPFFQTISRAVSLNDFSIQNPKTKEVVRGIAFAIPTLLLFTWLLSGADATLAKFFDTLVGFEFTENTIGYIIHTLIVAVFFLGAFGFMVTQIHSPAKDTTFYARTLGLLETSIPLIAINVLFCIFIILQIGTLFGGETHLTENGLTYAEYAREGFVQLIWVAIFSFLIVTFMEKRVVVQGERHVRSFRVVSGLLILQVVLILISAFQRLSLYEATYGFTTIRLFSHALMIWLGVALILLFYHIWKSERQEVFFFRLFCSTVVLLFAMNLLNPDVFITKKNLVRYAETGSIDSTYLGNLSYDALPYTIHLLHDPDYVIRRDYASALYFNSMYCFTSECEDGVSSWKSKRLNQREAEYLLKDNSTRIKTYAEYGTTWSD